MEALVSKGLVRSIGVSNFNVQSLVDLLSYAKIKPTVNQVELHPLGAQPGLVDSMKVLGVTPMAFAPTARGGGAQGLLDTDQIKKVAAVHGCSPNAVVLAWGLKRGYSIIPRSGSVGHQKENFEA